MHQIQSYMTLIVIGYALTLPDLYSAPAIPAIGSSGTPEFSVSEWIQKIDRRLKDTRSLMAKFEQTNIHHQLGPYRTHTGRVMIQKPNKIRWEYKTPDKKLILLAGTDLVIYKAAEKVAIIQKNFATQSHDSPSKAPDNKHQEARGRTVLAFLWQDVPLLTVFKSPQIIQSTDHLITLRFLPQQSIENISSVEISARRSDAQIECIHLIEVTGNSSKIHFSEITLNPSIPSAKFTFSPPPNTTVQHY